MLLKLMKDNVENTKVLGQDKDESIFYAKICKTTKVKCILKCRAPIAIAGNFIYSR